MKQRAGLLVSLKQSAVQTDIYKINYIKMKKIFLLTAALAFISVTGCKVDIKTGDDANNDKKTETGQQSSTENKSSGEAPKTDNSTGNDLGLAAGLPSNYPSDVPQPKDSKCLGSLNSSEGTVVTFESTQSVKDILDFYKGEMKKSGYDIGDGGEVLMSDKGGIIGWKKGDKEVGLMLGANEEKKNTSIVVTYK